MDKSCNIVWGWVWLSKVTGLSPDSSNEKSGTLYPTNESSKLQVIRRLVVLALLIIYIFLRISGFLDFYHLHFRTVLREIKKKGIRNIVVDTDPNNINYFFRVVLQLQMNNNKFHYMFTSFDVETYVLRFISELMVTIRFQ